MVKVCRQGTLIVADSYFGNIDSLNEITAMGLNALLACHSTRPSFLFKNFLNIGVTATNTRSATGITNHVPFVASASMSSTRKTVCTLSTVYSSNSCLATEVGLSRDDSEDVQFQRSLQQYQTTEIRLHYSHYMDAVDRMNSEINSVCPQHRHNHWTSPYAVWLLFVVVHVNARRLWQSITGKSITSTQWAQLVWRALSGIDDDFDSRHQLCRLKRMGNCKSCYVLCTRESGQKVRRQTTLFCPMCGHICKHCHPDRHQIYVNQSASMFKSVLPMK